MRQQSTRAVGDEAGELRLGAEGADVVDVVGAGVERGGGDGDLHRVDRDARRPCPRSPSTTGHDARELLLLATRGPSRAASTRRRCRGSPRPRRPSRGRARSRGAASSHRPPSENESGVTLTTPMTVNGSIGADNAAMLRAADPERDGAACAAVYAPYVEGSIVSFEEEAPDAAEMTRRIAATTREFPWLVAERDGEVAGYAYGSRHRDRAAYRWAADVAVYIDAPPPRPGHRPRAATRAASLGCATRTCAGRAPGSPCPNDASVGLHEALGFELVGVYREIGFKAGALARRRLVGAGPRRRLRARPARASRAARGRAPRRRRGRGAGSGRGRLAAGALGRAPAGRRGRRSAARRGRRPLPRSCRRAAPRTPPSRSSRA